MIFGNTFVHHFSRCPTSEIGWILRSIITIAVSIEIFCSENDFGCVFSWFRLQQLKSPHEMYNNLLPFFSVHFKLLRHVFYPRQPIQYKCGEKYHLRQNLFFWSISCLNFMNFISILAMLDGGFSSRSFFAPPLLLWEAPRSTSSSFTFCNFSNFSNAENAWLASSAIGPRDSRLLWKIPWNDQR